MDTKAYPSFPKKHLYITEKATKSGFFAKVIVESITYFFVNGE